MSELYYATSEGVIIEEKEKLSCTFRGGALTYRTYSWPQSPRSAWAPFNLYVKLSRDPSGDIVMAMMDKMFARKILKNREVGDEKKKHGDLNSSNGANLIFTRSHNFKEFFQRIIKRPQKFKR